ncbi:helix-turn-helix domain-containing protein [Rhodococcus erythropolis]
MTSISKFAWMEALRGADLTHAEYRVLINLSTYARGDLANARPSLQTLCDAARVTDKTAKKSIRTLIQKGWIVRTHEGGRGTGRTNIYALEIPKTLQGSDYPSNSETLEGAHCPPRASSREVFDADLGGRSVPPREVIDVHETGYSLPQSERTIRD